MAAPTHLKDQKHHPVICPAKPKEGFWFWGLKADQQQPQFSVQDQMGLGQGWLDGSGQLPM